ncbi:MAG: hypothetical protein QHC90_01545 [Shinella sp.]|nr:hypothetical protein [Shinella sp.]
MRTASIFLSAATVLLLSGGSAFAGCVDISESGTDSNKTAAIAKDGSKAPLETQSGQSAARTDSSEMAAKDGQTMPLADEKGEGNKNMATSQQDVEAQQEGEQTAAARANKGSCD